MREIDEFPDDESRLEQRRTEVKDTKEHSLTTEERDRIIRAYNGEISIIRELDSINPEEPRIIDSKSKLDSVILCNFELKLRKGYDTKYKKATDYLDSGMKGKKPVLIRESEDILIRFLYEELHGGSPNVIIESIEDIDKILEKRTGKKNDVDFQKQYNKSRVYFDVRYDNSKSHAELASIYGVQPAEIREYQNGKEPTLNTQLRRFEQERLIDEWRKNRLTGIIHGQESDILQRYLNSRDFKTLELKSSSTHNIFVSDSSKLCIASNKSNLNSLEEEDIVSIADVISHELLETESRVIYWILKEHPNTLSIITKNRVELEREVRRQVSAQNLHLGVVDDRLYVWNPDRTLNDMMNVWGEKYFYFDPCILSQFVMETGKHLNLDDSGYEQLSHLNNLIDQIVSNKPCDKIWTKHSKSKILGDVFHLQCDILGVSPRVLEKYIVRVSGKNGHGGVTHPKLLRDSELDILRARLGAIINSDCWLGEDGRLFYSEAEEERLKIVADLFRQFGDISLKIEPNKYNKSYRMWIPRPIGDAFISWGFTTCDKPVQNEQLSDVIINGSLESYIAYLEDLISEDGSFDSVNGFRWSRTIVLKLGEKDAKFLMDSKLSDDEIKFLTMFDDARRYSDEVYIPITRLERKVNNSSESESKIINHILEIIKDNRSRLLDDEASLARKLGISIQISPEYITLYRESGRISLKWVATTTRKDDAIKWALIASPNHPRKNGIVQEWLSKIPDDVRRIKEQLRKDGYQQFLE